MAEPLLLITTFGEQPLWAVKLETKYVTQEQTATTIRQLAGNVVSGWAPRPHGISYDTVKAHLITLGYEVWPAYGYDDEQVKGVVKLPEVSFEAAERLAKTRRRPRVRSIRIPKTR